MRRLLLIGIGAGNPDWVTTQAIDALNRADVIFVLDKGAEQADLAALRQEICDRYITGTYRTVHVSDPPRDLSGASYGAAVRSWHDQRVEIYRSMIEQELIPGQTGAFLVWGDPALYDSTIRLVDEVVAAGVDVTYEVIPGISALSALTAAFRIPLNRVGRSVLVTTGRKLADGIPDGADDVVVMLDGGCAFARLDEDVDIFWGAYLGTPDEILIGGPLRDCAEEIVRVRSLARERKGWMFDTYLLRARS